MFDRDACERRVYRLATLLTGNPAAATKVMAQVVDAQPDLRRLDSAHLDRLTVLRSREVQAGMLVDEGVALQLRESLAKLTAQQREAWVFGRVYELNDRDFARAMDCSVTAARRHLEQADHLLKQTMGSRADDAPQMIRQYSMTLDVPEFYRAQRLRRRQMRLMLKVAIIMVCALLLAALVMWLTRPMSGV